jgi:sterol desaturase/sphingolipid hydroxylase (fatty acid hydroxylase superfamily)
MPTEIGDFLSGLVSSFTDPQKRVFVGYLLSAWLIAFVWLLWIARANAGEALKTIFSPGDWLSNSARADYLILLFNRVILSMIAPRLISQLAIATTVFHGLHYGMSPGAGSSLPPWVTSLLFTVTLFLLDDASRYLVHRWMHHSPVMWRFHRVHHTATRLTPITIFRTHPVEGVLFVLRSAAVQGLSIGFFVFFFGGGVDLIDVLGANLFIFIFNAAGANLRHSPIAVRYPQRVERWLMSPAQHQIHHSNRREHFDRNYGVFLSVWDRLGGTLCHSTLGSTLDYGVSDHGGDEEHHLSSLYLKPFADAFRVVLAKHGNRLSADK